LYGARAHRSWRTACALLRRPRQIVNELAKSHRKRITTAIAEMTWIQVEELTAGITSL